MVYNTQNYWVFGFRPSSGILKTRKQNVSETACVSVLRWGRRYLLFWVPQKQLTSITANLVFRISNDGQKVQKSSNSEQHTVRLPKRCKLWTTLVYRLQWMKYAINYHESSRITRRAITWRLQSRHRGEWCTHELKKSGSEGKTRHNPAFALPPLLTQFCHCR
jgi:hypothetical protein